jgi:hypothetical protein
MYVLVSVIFGKCFEAEHDDSLRRARGPIKLEELQECPTAHPFRQVCRKEFSPEARLLRRPPVGKVEKYWIKAIGVNAQDIPAGVKISWFFLVGDKATIHVDCLTASPLQRQKRLRKPLQEQLSPRGFTEVGRECPPGGGMQAGREVAAGLKGWDHMGVLGCSGTRISLCDLSVKCPKLKTTQKCINATVVVIEFYFPVQKRIL